MNFDKEFLGQNFTWFIGKVEDRKDPLYIGRVKVRCFGWHPDAITTEQLPWAQTIQPVTTLPTTPSGLPNDTWVFGFFLDGEKAQRPMVMGHIPGYKFNSPGESDIPALGRGETAGVEFGKDNAATNNLPPSQSTSRGEALQDPLSKDVIVDPVNDIKWSEPEEAKDATYPFVQTHNSEGGVITQIVSGDPEGEAAGRHAIYYPAGGYEETGTDGVKVVKIVSDRYQLIAGDDYVHIAGSVNLTIDSDVTTHILGNLTENIIGNVTRNITGNLEEKVTGTVLQTYESTKTENVTGAVTENFSADQTTSIGGSATENISGSKTMAAGGSVAISGSTIDLN